MLFTGWRLMEKTKWKECLKIEIRRNNNFSMSMPVCHDIVTCQVKVKTEIEVIQ